MNVLFEKIIFKNLKKCKKTPKKHVFAQKCTKCEKKCQKLKNFKLNSSVPCRDPCFCALLKFKKVPSEAILTKKKRVVFYALAAQMRFFIAHDLTRQMSQWITAYRFLDLRCQGRKAMPPCWGVGGYPLSKGVETLLRVVGGLHLCRGLDHKKG